MRFTLKPDGWYAAEFIGDEFGDLLRSYSPIRIERMRPTGEGKRQFVLDFYHANYPAGVQGKRYLLQTLERSRRFLLARSQQHSPHRLLLIYDISWNWLHQHFGVERHNDNEDIERWLQQHA